MTNSEWQSTEYMRLRRGKDRYIIDGYTKLERCNSQSLDVHAQDKSSDRRNSAGHSLDWPCFRWLASLIDDGRSSYRRKGEGGKGEVLRRKGETLQNKEAQSDCNGGKSHRECEGDRRIERRDERVLEGLNDIGRTPKQAVYERF